MIWKQAGLARANYHHIRLRFCLRFGFAFSLLMHVEICWDDENKGMHVEICPWKGRCDHEGDDVPMKGKMCPWRGKCTLEKGTFIMWKHGMWHIWLRFRVSGFALWGYIQIIDPYSTRIHVEEVNLLACCSYDYHVINFYKLAELKLPTVPNRSE